MRRRARRRTEPPSDSVELPQGNLEVVQVCHPDWRGVRTSAVAFRDPVLERRDLRELIPVVAEMTDGGTRVVAIQGWPPGAGDFARSAAAAGIEVVAVFHSSPSQHGVDGGESEAVRSMLDLLDEGAISRVGSVKAGVHQAFGAIGHTVTHVPNRPPLVEEVEPAPVDEGTNIGVFLFPMWRKNVTTQVLAVLENGWQPHVMSDPAVAYLTGERLTIHGELDREAFLGVEAAMTMNFNVTLSECHPMMPMESYRLGVPCLISRTSDLFADAPDLHGLTTVAEADNPSAIAAKARELLENRTEAVAAANEALDRLDVRAASAWAEFTGR